jgi:hypothetical protein
MIETKSPKKAPASPPEKPPKPAMRAQPIKMRAVQRLFYDNRIVSEGEVYWYYHQELPAEHIAVPAPDSVPIGAVISMAPEPDPKVPPPWTQAGYVTQNRSRDLSQIKGPSE